MLRLLVFCCKCRELSFKLIRIFGENWVNEGSNEFEPDCNFALLLLVLHCLFELNIGNHIGLTNLITFKEFGVLESAIEGFQVVGADNFLFGECALRDERH